MDAWMWPLGGKYVDNGIPCPALLWESSEFLSDRDAFTAFNSQISSILTLRSRAAWKVVSPVAGHYEYTDMALCCPRFLQAVGLVNLSPQEVIEFQAYQSALILDFLRAQLAAGGQAGEQAEPSGRAAPKAPRSLLTAAVGAAASAPCEDEAVEGEDADDDDIEPQTPPGGSAASAAAVRRWSFGSASEAFLTGPAEVLGIDVSSFWGPLSCRSPGVLARGTDDGLLETSPGKRAGRKARRLREREQARRHRQHMREQRLLHCGQEPHPPALPMSPKRLGPLTWLSGVAGSVRAMHQGAPDPPPGGAGGYTTHSGRHGLSPLRRTVGSEESASAGAQSSAFVSAASSRYASATSTARSADGNSASNPFHSGSRVSFDAGGPADPPSDETDLLRSLTRSAVGSRCGSVANGGAGAGGASGETWDPPEEPRFGKLMSSLELAEQAAQLGWTVKQRAAMKLLVQQVQLGEYETLGLSRHVEIFEELPEILVQVIHYRSHDSLRSIVREVFAELKAAAPPGAQQQQKQSKAMGATGGGGEEEHVVVSL